MSGKITQIDKGRMKRVLGVFDLFAVGYGDLGSSIYYALGITALYALGATPIALMLAGFVFVCTAITYAEMSTVIEETSGSAAFARKSINDLISFVAGWGLLLDYIVTIAISTYAVGPYLAYFLPFLKYMWPKLLFPVVMIGGMVFLNMRGGKESTRISLVLTCLTVLTQVTIIVIGALTLVNFPTFWSHLAIGGANKLWSPSWTDFIHGVAMAMVAYTGIESMTGLSSEAIDPKKTVPRAIMLAMGTLLLMYLGVSIVALSAVSPAELSTTYLEDPVAGIVSALPYGGKVLGPWVGILAAVILLVAGNAGLMGASRLSFNMGEYFQLPRFFYNLHPKYKTPYISLFIFAVFAALIIIWSRGRIAFLADLYNFGAMLAFSCSHISLIIHRIRFPDMHRPFKAPLNIPVGKGRSIPITAVIGAISTISVWILVVVTKPEGRYLGIAWMTAGLVMYFAHRRSYKLSPVGQLEVEKIQIDDFKDVKIKKILLPTRGHLATDTIVIGCNLAKLYDAEITVVHIVEVSYMLPMNTPLLQRDTYSEAVLKRAEAIGVEKKVRIDVRMIRSRSIVKTISEMIEDEGFDLLVLGSQKMTALGPVTEKILKSAKCRVWVCRGGDPHSQEASNQDLYHKISPSDPDSEDL